MHVFQDDTTVLHGWIRDELILGEPVGVGRGGQDVRRIQEWLTIRGLPLAIDGDFGVATAETVARFQAQSFLPSNGRVDAATFTAMVEPMEDILRQRLRSSMPIGEALAIYAHAHLDKHPVEAGGQNKGPWVRMYMQGHDGASWPWCAGFVTFLMRQACESMQIDVPIQGSFSCDTIVAQAREAGLFVSETDAAGATLPAGSLFLNRKTSTDWSHIGVVIEADALTFTTIEGNTNDEGSREGFEVCMRTRAYGNRDFIVFG